MHSCMCDFPIDTTISALIFHRFFFWCVLCSLAIFHKMLARLHIVWEFMSPVNHPCSHISISMHTLCPHYGHGHTNFWPVSVSGLEIIYLSYIKDIDMNGVPFLRTTWRAHVRAGYNGPCTSNRMSINNNNNNSSKSIDIYGKMEFVG
jgi:hypothetical protein